MNDCAPACPYCEGRHAERYLCDPVKTIMDAMVARGRSYDMPTVELGEPIIDPNIGLPGDRMLAQLVVKAATIPVAGVFRPALVFTGVDGVSRRPLPNWVYPGRAPDIQRAMRLVSDMGELAMRTARQQQTG